MIKYYKNIRESYIAGIGTNSGDVEITQEEYETILDIIRDRPIPEAGYDYRLKTDLTWELVEAPEPVDDEISDAEALDIILGGEA